MAAKKALKSVTADQLLARHTPGVRSVANRLRNLVKQSVPDIEEKTYQGAHGIGYQHPRAGSVCGIFPQESSVKLGFERGSVLQDPDLLLEGSGTLVRFISIRASGSIPVEAIARFLREAVSRGHEARQ